MDKKCEKRGSIEENEKQTDTHTLNQIRLKFQRLIMRKYGLENVIQHVN